jgi:hypothetical protein
VTIPVDRRMTIITRKRSENFAIVPNAVAEDDRVSFEARGVLVYLLAKPNDWHVQIKDIMRAGNIGRDKVYRILKELRTAGYVRLVVHRNADQTIASQEYEVYDNPVPDQLPFPEKAEEAEPLPENPEVGEPLPEKPRPAKPHPEKPDGIIRNKNTNNISPLLAGDSGSSASFGALWSSVKADHRPPNRQGAEALFVALPSTLYRELAVKHWPLFARIQMLRKKKPSLTTYLRHKLFRELNGAPDIDNDGDFIITPDREEWPAWLDWTRQKIGEAGVQSVKRMGKLLVKERWPDGVGRQLEMAVTG